MRPRSEKHQKPLILGMVMIIANVVGGIFAIAYGAAAIKVVGV